MKRIDLTGRRFGRWIALERAEDNRFGHARWVCRCECGTTRTVLANTLRSGASRSCGCLKAQVARVRSGDPALHPAWKHGHGRRGRRSPEFGSWLEAKKRCLNPNHHQHADYGGRGITMCPEWRDSFERFLADMGPRPEGTTLDRIDNDGPYAPGNCRWATRKQQANNTRRQRAKVEGG